MVPNRKLFKLLAIIELVLAVLFAVVCLFVVLLYPDSLQLQFLLAVIGLAGVMNGLFLIRKVKQSRQPVRRGAQRETTAAGRTGNGKSKKK